jgi:hypothetical protein
VTRRARNAVEVVTRGTIVSANGIGVRYEYSYEDEEYHVIIIVVPTE